jgi:DNA (cytosine-5)-methyltransferase 1
MTGLTCGDVFSGGGGFSLGALAAGFTPAWAIEHDPTIAEVYAANIGAHVIVKAAQDVDPRTLEPVDLLLASPPCQSHSNARARSLPARDDAEVGLCVLDYVRILRPRFVMIENVEGWKRSRSFKAIFHGLHGFGYYCDVRVLNAADFGVPQTRRRLILRASREGFLPSLPPPTPWRGWYEAIEDLIPDLPESRFAEWQLARLGDYFPQGAFLQMSGATSGHEETRGNGVKEPDDPAGTVALNSGHARAFLVGDQNSERKGLNIVCRDSDSPALTVRTAGGYHQKAFIARATDQLESVNIAHGRIKAFVVDCQEAGAVSESGERGVTVRHSDAPMFTVSASVNPTESMKRPIRAWLEQGRVVAMNARALARFMGIPDSYKLPEKSGLACKIIGNAVCPPLAEQLITVLKKLSS